MKNEIKWSFYIWWFLISHDIFLKIWVRPIWVWHNLDNLALNYCIIKLLKSSIVVHIYFFTYGQIGLIGQDKMHLDRFACLHTHIFSSSSLNEIFCSHQTKHIYFRIFIIQIMFSQSYTQSFSSIWNLYLNVYSYAIQTLRYKYLRVELLTLFV